MAECSVCGKPATSQITITENGQRRQLMLCDQHYMEFMARNQRRLSPLESLFHGGLFESLFDDMWPQMEDDRGSRSRIRRAPGQSGGAEQDTGTGSGQIGDSAGGQSGGRTRRHRRAREAVDLQTYLSQSGLDRLQAAAQAAVEYGKNEVDTEHLLLALADNNVVQEVLREFKLDPEEIKKTIDQTAPRGTRKEPSDNEQIGVSPRAKSALENALKASQELGHSYVGPEHILIGLVEEEDGFAGELLRKLGLSSPSLRQKQSRWSARVPKTARWRAARPRPRSTSTRAISARLRVKASWIR